MLYESPEQPPPWIPRRSPPSSGETPSLAMATRIRFRARSVIWMPFWFGAAFSALRTASSIGLVGNRCCGFRRLGYAVLLFPVADGSADCIFRQHRAVNLDRR